MRRFGARRGLSGVLRPPPTPTGNSVAPVSDTVLGVYVFNVPSSNETGFYWERSADGVSGWVLAGTTGPNIWYFFDNGLSPNTLYYYRVRARNNAGYSAYSSVASGTTFYTEASNYFVAASLSDPIELDAANTFIGFLVDNGAWGLLDRLWLVSSQDASAAKICCKSLTQLGDPFDNVTYDYINGFVFGSGTGEYLEDTQDFSDATHYGLNFNSMYMFFQSQDLQKGAFMGASVGTFDTSNQCTVMYQDGSAQPSGFATDSSSSCENGATGPSSALYIVNTNGSGASDHELYIDGGTAVATGIGATVATALANYPIHIHGYNEDGVNSASAPAFNWIGGGYGDSLKEAVTVDQFNDAFYAYQIAIGRTF